MQEQDIKKVVAEVLAEQKRLHNNEVDEGVLKTLTQMLTTYGIEEDNRAEMRADLLHLRRWRKASETIEKTTWRTMVTVLVTGALGLLWLGIQSKFFGK